MIYRLIEILHRGDNSLVIDNGTIHTYDGHGVSDFHRIYTTEPQILNGSTVADKVVGKGAAISFSGLLPNGLSKEILFLLARTSVSVSPE